jgi:hypothetical protein
MGDKHYLEDLEAGTFLRSEKLIIITQEAFNRMGDYTRGQPTGPTPGRIYRKNHDWREGTPDQWWVFICEPAPEAGFVDHHPHRVQIETPERIALIEDVSFRIWHSQVRAEPDWSGDEYGPQDFLNLTTLPQRGRFYNLAQELIGVIDAQRLCS